MRLQGVPQRCLCIDAVEVAPSVPLAFQNPRLLKFGHDPLYPSLRQSDLCRYVTQRLCAVGGQTDQDMGVVAKKGPAPCGGYF